MKIFGSLLSTVVPAQEVALMTLLRLYERCCTARRSYGSSAFINFCSQLPMFCNIIANPQLQGHGFHEALLIAETLALLSHLAALAHSEGMDVYWL